MQIEEIMDEELSSLFKRLDLALDSKALAPEDVELRLSLLQPLEHSVASWRQFPDTPTDRPSIKIARLLWLKTHLDKKDLSFVMAQLQDQNPIIRATAADALSVILGSGRQQWFDSSLAQRFRNVVEQQRKRETSPLISYQLGQILEQVGRYARSRSAPKPPVMNPYVAGPPIREKDKFFGRQDVLEEIERSFSSGIRSFIIYGGRRTGKTSLLYQIREGAMGQSYVPAYLDLQGLAGATLSDLLAALQSAIQSALPSSRLTSFSERPLNFISLQNFIGKVLDEIKPQSLLLMLDEYEILKDYINDADVARGLQHLWENEPRLSFIFAGSKKVEDLEEKNFLLLLDASKYKKISFLKKEDARRLITMPAQGALEFSEGVTERIEELCGGHPFYIQLLCYSLFNLVKGRGNVTLEHVELAVHEFLENPTPHLILSWNGLPLDRKITASALAAESRRERSLTASDLAWYLHQQKYPVKLGNTELQQALSELRESDWLERMEAGTHYRFALDLVRRWIAGYRTIWDLLQEQQRSISVRIASVRRRGVAFLIDFLALALFVVIVMGSIRFGWIYLWKAILSNPWSWLLPFITVGYYTISMLIGRMTLGMWITRVEVLDEAGTPLRHLRAVLLGTLVSLPLLTLSLLFVFGHAGHRGIAVGSGIFGLVLGFLQACTIHFSKKHQGLFDRLSKAVLVRRLEPTKR